jgi:hypothetical protein
MHSRLNNLVERNRETAVPLRESGSKRNKFIPAMTIWLSHGLDVTELETAEGLELFGRGKGRLRLARASSASLADSNPTVRRSRWRGHLADRLPLL